jgi:hypothetical protein
MSGKTRFDSYYNHFISFKKIMFPRRNLPAAPDCQSSPPGLAPKPSSFLTASR